MAPACRPALADPYYGAAVGVYYDDPDLYDPVPSTTVVVTRRVVYAPPVHVAYVPRPYYGYRHGFYGGPRAVHYGGFYGGRGGYYGGPHVRHYARLGGHYGGGGHYGFRRGRW
jgi:hypothetical protein